MAVKKYHLRWQEKAITKKSELFKIIRQQKHMTFAMCKDNEPYLVTVNHGFDRRKNCLYFHCATKGKKMDFLKAHPVVWCQVLADSGYINGRCTHKYRSVQFNGKVKFLRSKKDKLDALNVMLDHLEKNPKRMKRSLEQANLDKVAIGCIKIGQMTGKKYKPD
ncbi:MAG TPA: pyridoxamine 5'-phosphate oxidase family protein [bacterium]